MYICPGFSKDNKTFSKINLIKKKIETEEETEKIKKKNNLKE